MTLIQMYNFIKFIADKDFNGNFFKPEQYKLAIIAANIDLYKKVSGLPEEYQPGNPVAREYFEMNKKALDEVRHFKEHVFNQAVANGYFTIPDDYVYKDSASYNWQVTIDGEADILPRPVEFLTEDQNADRRGNYTKRPTLKYPTAVIRVQGGEAKYQRIYLYPNTINAVDFHYFRLPKEPVFDYTIVSNEIVYAPATSTEFEWGIIKHMDLVRIMTSYLGINLREENLLQYAEMQKAKGI